MCWLSILFFRCACGFLFNPIKNSLYSLPSHRAVRIGDTADVHGLSVRYQRHRAHVMARSYQKSNTS